jgi:hypothetical protein
MGKMFIQGLEEVMGRNEIDPVIRQTSLKLTPQGYPPENLNPEVSYSDLSQIQQLILQSYGSRSGRGLAYRSGQASLKYGLQEIGDQFGLNELSFRLLPLPRRVYIGLQRLALAFSGQSDQRIYLSEERTIYIWRVENCPHCWGLQAVEPVCNMVTGFLQEFLSWMSGGRFYHVIETECVACGDPACVYQIDKQPIE